MNSKEKHQCQYPELYKEFSAIFKNTSLDISLPIDNNGFCLFHSNDLEWKIANNFNQRFSTLLQLLDLYKKERNTDGFSYQFNGFIFVGGETLIKIFGKSEIANAILIKDLQGKKIDFRNAVFINDVFIENLSFDNASFDYAVFKGTSNFTSIKFKSSYFCNSVFENNFHCKFVDFFQEVLFSNALFNKKFTIERSNFSDISDFSDVQFNGLTKFIDIVFKSQVKFSNTFFRNIVIFNKIKIESIVDFIETEFEFSEDVSYISSVQFEEINITQSGLLFFKGKSPQYDMIKGDVQFSFIDGFEGKVKFENFNLNKIAPFWKLKLLELEKLEKVEIGKGCRKYYCQTEIFKIATSTSNQDLIIDIVKVFCNYFKIEQSYILGVEIIKRTASEIHYFYFTDEVISEIDFNNKIKRNEIDLWNTLVNLTEKAQKVISTENIGLIDCLLDLSNWWKKIGIRIVKNQLNPTDLTKIANSISLDKNSEEFIIKAFNEINERFNIAIRGNVFIQNIDMRNIIELKDVNNTTIYQDVNNTNIKSI